MKSYKLKFQHRLQLTISSSPRKITNCVIALQQEKRIKNVTKQRQTEKHFPRCVTPTSL